MQHPVFDLITQFFVCSISHPLDQLALVCHNALHGIIHNIFTSKDDLRLLEMIQQLTHKTDSRRICNRIEIVKSGKKILPRQGFTGFIIQFHDIQMIGILYTVQIFHGLLLIK